MHALLQYNVRFAGTLAEGISKIDEAYARAGAAELRTRGRVTFDTQRSFSLAGQLRNFDPAKFGAYPSHPINGRFDLQGHVEPVLQVAANVNVTDSKPLTACPRRRMALSDRSAATIPTSAWT